MQKFSETVICSKEIPYLKKQMTNRARKCPTTVKVFYVKQNTVELQWVEHLWDYENMFETGVVRANEC